MGFEGHKRSSKLHWSRDLILGKAQSKGATGPCRVSTGLAFGGHREVTKRPQKFPNEEERG